MRLQGLREDAADRVAGTCVDPTGTGSTGDGRMQYLDTSGILCRPVGSSEELEAVLDFHAQVYVDAGIVDSPDHELLHDSCIAESTYFAAYQEGKLVGCARLIPHSERVPLYQLLEIWPAWKEQLEELPLDDIGYEVSALSVLRTAPAGPHTVTAALYREMVRHSISQGRTVWLAIITPMLRRILDRAFHVPLDIIGPGKQLVGTSRMPCVIDLVRLIGRYREESPRLWEALTSEVEIDLTRLEPSVERPGVGHEV